MLEGNIRDAELRRELGVPPAVDLLGHARDLARVALPAAVVAAIVALAVFFVRDSGPGVYQSTVVAEIRSGSVISGSDATLGQLIAPYVALSEDSRVVAAIAAEVGVDPAELSSNISVDYGSSPTLLTVTALDDSQEEADRLAQVVVAALDQAQATRNRTSVEARIADLDAIVAGLRTDLATSIARSDDGDPDPGIQSELDFRLDQLRTVRSGAGSEYLQILATPAGTGEKVSPKPKAEAAVAFLLTLIVVAEMMVALDGRFGTKITPGWARRTSRRYRTALQIDKSGAQHLPLDTVVMLQQRASLGESILILDGTGVVVDADVFGDSASENITRSSLGEQWWKQMRSERLALALIVVTSGTEERDAVEDGVRALAEIQVPVRLVVLSAEKPPAPAPVPAAQETPAQPAPEAPTPPARKVPVPSGQGIPTPAPWEVPLVPVEPAPPTEPIALNQKSLFRPPEDPSYARYRHDDDEYPSREQDQDQGRSPAPDAEREPAPDTAYTPASDAEHEPPPEEEYVPASESYNRRYAEQYLRNHEDQGPSERF